MSDHICWIHEKALSRAGHAPSARAVFIWDDAYFQRRNYSLKRLVFIYETLCTLDIEILRGDTLDVLGKLAPKTITVTPTTDPGANALIQTICTHFHVEMVAPAPFVPTLETVDVKRFFRYWNKASKHALRKNGGH